MRILRPGRPCPALVVAAALLALGTLGSRGTVTLEDRLVVEFEVLRVEEGRTESLDRFEVEVPPTGEASVVRSLAWPSEASRSRLELSVSGSLPEEGDVFPVRVEATLAPPGEPPVLVERGVRAIEGSSSLVDVYAVDRSRIVLSFTAERSPRPVVRSLPSAGKPVRFVVEVEWIDGERAVPVEANELNSLVGESVEYSFTFRGGDSPEGMRLVLTPTRMDDDVLRVVADVSGSLPQKDGPLLVSRRQDLVTSRGATSSVTVAVGVPPSGYRFRITPHF